jgi:hypothetical protein
MSTLFLERGLLLLLFIRLSECNMAICKNMFSRARGENCCFHFRVSRGSRVNRYINDKSTFIEEIINVCARNY